jgi:hypothetical protein
LAHESDQTGGKVRVGVDAGRGRRPIRQRGKFRG